MNRLRHRTQPTQRAFALLVCLALSMGTAVAAADLFADPVIARGKGVLVRQSDLDEAFITYKANLIAQRRAIPESERALREAQLLDRLIVTQILITRVTDEDRAKARKIASEFLADTKKTVYSEDGFERQLKAMGMTMAEFNVRVMEQALADAVLERELKSNIQITDAEVRNFYDTGRDLVVTTAEDQLQRLIADNKLSPEQIDQAKNRIEQIRTSNLEKLQEPERAHVSHLFFSTLDRVTEEPLPEEEQRAKRATIEKLLLRAKAGEDFARLIELYSEDRRFKETKGVYVVTRDSRFAPAFKSAAFTLRPGQISDVVASALGLHIIKCHDQLPASKVPFEETSEEIRRFLAEQELQKRLPGYFSNLKKEAQAEIISPKYNVNFDELGLLPRVNE